MASADRDVPTSVPSSPATPSTFAVGSPASSAHRSCPRCARRMSSLKYDKHTICRDVQCSVDVRCNGCNSWSVDFMLGYVKHQKSLVSKGKKKTPTSSSSSPSRPPVVQTTAHVAPPQLPASTEDQLKTYVHSFLSEFLSQSGQLGTNSFLTPFSSAPLSVPAPSSAPVSTSSLSSAPPSSSSLDFVEYQAHVLGLSSEYLSIVRWFVRARGSDFLSYLSSHFPCLSADACLA